MAQANVGAFYFMGGRAQERRHRHHVVGGSGRRSGSECAVQSRRDPCEG
jgi:hypothetical protein